jgi:His/Glu/Gln/Arg/opine family amino acid ABC transporter permease subunit
MKISLPEIGVMTLEAAKGIPATLLLTALVFLLSSVLGFLAALSRMNGKHGILNRILACYVSFERGCPAIVQILLLYTALPRLLDQAFSKTAFRPSNLPSMIYAVLILTLIQTAFLAEVFRGGLKSVSKGQYEAAVCSGLSGTQAYTRIIIPQVLHNLLPVLCSSLNGLIKLTALSFAMTVHDIMANPKIRAGKNFHYIEAYAGIAVIYIIIGLLVELGFKLLEKRGSRSTEVRLNAQLRKGGDINNALSKEYTKDVRRQSDSAGRRSGCGEGRCDRHPRPQRLGKDDAAPMHQLS